jgi:hypothetical protein
MSETDWVGLNGIHHEKTGTLIQGFKVQTLRALARLYKRFPIPTTLDSNTLLKERDVELENGDLVTVQEAETGNEFATILWLYREGFVSGDLQGGKETRRQSLTITNAQLTAKALRTLEDTDPSVGVLGEYVVASAFGPSETKAALGPSEIEAALGPSSSETEAANFLARRLLGS